MRLLIILSLILYVNSFEPFQIGSIQSLYGYKYRILKEIAIDNYSAVYYAKNIQDNISYSINILPRWLYL